MPASIRTVLIVFSFMFVLIGGYYRIQSQRSGESLDRSKEGWPLFIWIRVLGLVTLGSTIAWFWRPALFDWASLSVPPSVRWIGLTGFVIGLAWLVWMFRTLGRNLTDTVVTRRDAFLVQGGPYRLVRHPMYVGMPILGLSLGLALGTWLLPLAASLVFTAQALRTRIEERYLIERFGDSYRDYMKRVGRFFPRWPH